MWKNNLITKVVLQPRFIGSNRYWGGRPKKTVYFAVKFCQRLGPRLPPTVDKRDTVLGGNTFAPSFAVAR